MLLLIDNYDSLYGVLGTLNIADMANKVPQLSGDDVYLAKAGGLLLLVVFALKSALLPLHLWLPNAYSSATPVVAAAWRCRAAVRDGGTLCTVARSLWFRTRRRRLLAR